MRAKKFHQQGGHVKLQRPAQVKNITVRDIPVEHGLDARQIQSDLKNIDLPMHEIRVPGDKNSEQG
jgi:hypothetical protein